MDFQRRINGVKDALEEAGCDALVAAGAAPTQYLSGFEAYSDGGTRGWYPLVVVPRDGEACLFVSGLDAGAAEETAKIRIQVPDGSFSDAVQDVLDEDDTVALSENMTAGLYSRLADSLSVTFDDVLSDIRAVKEEDEVEATRTAVEMTEDVFSDMLQELDAEMTESEVAGVIEHGMRNRGGIAGFPSIVAAGSMAAHPHHAPRDTAVGEDAVLFDIGARYDGYVADIARTVYIGTPPDQFRQAYEAVRAALEAAEQELAAGADVSDIDGVARETLASAGYEDGYPHAAGHGVGLSVHEPPKISGSVDETLEAGNVVTLEPGVYRDGEFGVRIEDIYVIREGGAERLTTRSRALEDHIIGV